MRAVQLERSNLVSEGFTDGLCFFGRVLLDYAAYMELHREEVS